MESSITIDQLDHLITNIKKTNQTIVLVGGCFDILHPGHVAFLKKAKEQGNILIVLLESDQKITELKGAKRPIHTEQQRAEIVSSIRFVDYVVVLPYLTNNQEYDNLVRRINPNVIAITQGDPARIHKERQATLVGAKLVEVTPYIPANSTSRLAEKLVKEI